jgi:hypothetical protein
MKIMALSISSSAAETHAVQRFSDRFCFSKVDRYFDAPFNRSDKFVIADNPAKFTCAVVISGYWKRAAAQDMGKQGRL